MRYILKDFVYVSGAEFSVYASASTLEKLYDDVRTNHWSADVAMVYDKAEFNSRDESKDYDLISDGMIALLDAGNYEVDYEPEKNYAD